VTGVACVGSAAILMTGVAGVTSAAGTLTGGVATELRGPPCDGSRTYVVPRQ
jgi:hypothetical protein